MANTNADNERRIDALEKESAELKRRIEGLERALNCLLPKGAQIGPPDHIIVNLKGE
jgi:predicted  nucleic acid-binding Zn-ribbon protein